MKSGGKNWEWDFSEAVQVFLKTYWDDLGAAGRARKKLLKQDHIEELPFEWTSGLIAEKTPGGTPVFFLHGTPGSALRWSQYLKDVPEGYKFIAFDRPGFEPGAQIPPDLAKDSKALLKAVQYICDGQAPIIIGHSLGGSLAAYLAAELGPKAKGLVLIASSVNPDLERVFPVQHYAETVPLSWSLSRSIRHSNREMIQLLGFLRGVEKDYHNITCPVHVIHARDDKLVPFGHADYARTAFKNARQISVTELKTGGHTIPWTRSDLIFQAIQSFPEPIQKAA